MLSLDHVVFPTWDAPASLRFYRDIMGLPLTHALVGDDWGGAPWLMMVFALEGGRELVLVALRGMRPPPPSGLPADTRHYAFSVADRTEQDGWRAKLTAAGVPVSEENHGDQNSIYFTDPNGVVLEITTPPSDADAIEDPGAVERARRWMMEGAVSAA
jgi:catechol 2,3-dioxygenase-like lactoylglutathione lyase family enzyme